ncbi:MAG: MgtC/SapB family protein [Candidatus Aenigmarchaeota archaeon]|nr:MgtC/SapB family protein [Candidatus Aenigmarchaeota archaeon]
MVVELTGTTAGFVVGEASIIEFILRLVISVILGAIVGFERQISNKPAGMRTHMIVSLGACLITLTAISAFKEDPARVASGIVTGIGFIGAGNIIASRGRVHGITTAATLWVVAGVGLAIGAGSYVLAIASSILVFLILQFKRVERRL